jgi:LPXTG-site transpeptidase (sortase) family protein
VHAPAPLYGGAGAGNAAVMLTMNWLTWLSKIRSSFLFLLGVLMVYFGASGVVETTQVLLPFLEQAPEEEVVIIDAGFVPVSVPLDNSRAKIERSDADAAVGLSLADNESVAPVIDKPAVAPATSGDESQAPAAVAKKPKPEYPSRIIIGSIQMDAEIIPATAQKVAIGKQEFIQWLAPNQAAAGWHSQSALLGEIGNTVLNGHHNVYGKVFQRLTDVSVGDRIVVFGDDGTAFNYVITNKMILPEKNVTVEEREENARWILPSTDERLTLVTCWPYESNTHRLIIVAQPIDS